MLSNFSSHVAKEHYTNPGYGVVGQEGKIKCGLVKWLSVWVGGWGRVPPGNHRIVTLWTTMLNSERKGMNTRCVAHMLSWEVEAGGL